MTSGTDHLAQLSPDRLIAVVRAATLINSTLDLPELIDRILHFAVEEIGCERGTLFLADRDRCELVSLVAQGSGGTEFRLPFGRGIAGTVAEQGRPVIIADPYQDPRFDPSHDRKSGFRTRNIATVPVASRDGELAAVLQILNKRDGPFDKVDIDFLLAIAPHAAIALENARLHAAMCAKARVDRELALAREIQAGQIPEHPPQVPGLGFSFSSDPCYETAGDYYDVFPGENGSWFVAVADVSGKGVPAAIIVATLRATLRLLPDLPGTLPERLSRINQLLAEPVKGKRFVTLFIGQWQPETRTLTTVNAGHESPRLFLADGSSRTLEAGGPPLGILRKLSYDQETSQIPPGATLFVTTDGVTEAAAADGRLYGETRLGRFLADHHTEAPEDLLAHLVTDVAIFTGGAPPEDDRTIMVMRGI
jgi:sigma-B regulation protein RsbU (phosphoserine phosphatase)